MEEKGEKASISFISPWVGEVAWLKLLLVRSYFQSRMES